MKAQRESWHGVDYMYHGDISFDEFFHRYTETLMGVDDSVGAVLDYLDASGLAKDTLVIYMGDNGFSFGEHGLIDKGISMKNLQRYPCWSDGRKC